MVRKTVSPSSTAYKASVSNESSAKERLNFKFPSTPLLSHNISSDSDDGASESSSADDIESSPATSPEMLLHKPAGLGIQKLGPILEFAPSSSGVSPDQSPLANRQTRFQQHRFSPSNPYGSFNPTLLNTPQQQQTSSFSPSNFARLLASKLRRAKILDLSFGAIFTVSLLVFIAALSGVGYQPPHKTAIPLVTSHHVPAQAPPRQVAREEIRMPVEQAQPQVEPINAQAVDQEAPLVIKEDDETVNTEESDEEREIHHLLGRRPAAKAGDGRRMRTHDAEHDILQQKIADLKAEQMRELEQLVQEDIEVQEEEDDAVIGSSPQDAALDDEHAAHYHHEKENVFDQDFQPVLDPETAPHQDHDHSSFEAMEEAELIDEQEEEDAEASRDLELSEMEDDAELK